MRRGVDGRHVLIVGNLNLELMAHLGLHQCATDHISTPDTCATDDNVFLAVVLGKGGLAAEAVSKESEGGMRDKVN